MGIEARKDNPLVSKLTIVRNELMANPDVVYAGDTPNHHPIGSARDIKIFIAPKNPLFSIGALNDFMHGLVKSVKPFEINDASPGYNVDGPGISIGSLRYDETIAKVRTNIETFTTVIDSELAEEFNIKAGLFFTSRDDYIMRLIRVYIYPEEYSARTIHARSARIPESERKGCIDGFDSVFEIGPRDIERLKEIHSLGVKEEPQTTGESQKTLSALDPIIRRFFRIGK